VFLHVFTGLTEKFGCVLVVGFVARFRIAGTDAEG